MQEKPKTTDLGVQDIQVDVPETEAEKDPTDKPTRAQGTRAVKPDASKDPKSNLTEEQRKLLERMGAGGGGPDLGRYNQPRGESAGGGGPSLTPSQLTGVVQNNKVQLQRCYETALRAAGGKQDGAIKITVKVTVGMSGTVKKVGTTGTGLGSMTECMKSSVRRWRFPQSGGDSEFEFPLVFQPGA